MNRDLPILVIGGGIHGASFACLLAVAGQKVLLAEQNDFVSGASSNSMKTTHGGLRNLGRLEFLKAVECIRARADVHRHFPDLVRPLPFYSPNISFLQNRFTARVGAGLYNTLCRIYAGGLLRTIGPASVVPLRDYREHYANFSTPTGKTALRWCDLQVVESEMLVLRMLQAAARFGARVENYLEVVGIEPLDEGYEVTFQNTRGERRHAERFKDVFDCSGPGRVTETALGKIDRSVKFIHAVNLVVPGLLSGAAVALNAAGIGHQLFVVPWKRSTIFGTWYFDSSAAHMSCGDPIAECLNDIARICTTPIRREDVSLIHVGQLPAARTKSETPVHTRLLTQSSCRLLHRTSTNSRVYLVRGTKYTTALSLAKRVVRRIYKTQMSRLNSETIFCGPGDATASETIRQLARDTKARSLVDFVRRRSSFGDEGMPSEELVRDSAVIMSELRGWTAEETELQVARLREYYATARKKLV